MAEDSMTSYQKTGFGESDGAKDLQKTLNGIATTQSKLRKEAVAQYANTYKIETESLTAQLNSLIQSQKNDSELLNKSYQQSVNSMMAKLRERGLDAGAQPHSTEAALHQYYDEVMDQRNVAYNVQKAAIKAKQKTLKGNYEQNIVSRMSQNRLNNLKSASELLTKIASIQSESYQNYINYLLAEQEQNEARAARSHHGGGGGRRYYRGGYYGGRRYYGGRNYYGRKSSGGGGGSSGGTTSTGSSGLGSNYFTNLLGGGGKGPGIANSIVGAIKTTVSTIGSGILKLGDWVANAKKK